MGDLPGDEPLGRELLVSAAQHRQAAGDGRRRHVGIEQAALIHFDMVGGHLQGSDALGLHVADEIHEVAAIRLDRVVGQQGVADPRDQRGRAGRRSAGFQGVSQERLDLVGGRGVALKEVAALGDEGRARWRERQSRELGINLIDQWRSFLIARLHGRQFKVRCAAVPSVGENHLGVGAGVIRGV